jgi:hypothetical protein
MQRKQEAREAEQPQTHAEGLYLRGCSSGATQRPGKKQERALDSASCRLRRCSLAYLKKNVAEFWPMGGDRFQQGTPVQKE